MPIQWTSERMISWRDEGLVEEDVRAAGRWRLRSISNRSSPAPAMADFDAILARHQGELALCVRPFGTGAPFATAATATGTSLQVLENITLGTRHEFTVRVKPSDASIARWSCTCGTTSRGAATPEMAREAAEAHVQFATDARPRFVDRAVAQGDDGRWADEVVSIAQRYRACVRSELSTARSHRGGVGEDFEIAVDGRMRLWLRRLGSEAALRRDEDGRGVSLLVFDR